VNLPTSPGDLFSFDFIIADIGDLTGDAQGFQAIVSVSGPGVLDGNEPGSIAVSGVNGYWLSGNSSADFIDHGDNSYTFGDNPENAIAQPLDNGDILARYAFTWGGTAGNYTFTLDLDTSNSYVLNEFYSKEPLQFDRGGYPGDDDSFTVTIPEPTTICCLLGLGTLAMLRKRRV
jgi:hypothetical protein